VDDAEAVELLRQGDRRGPEALLDRYQMSVYNLSLRMLGNPADAEDATQEVFLRAFERLSQYRPDQPFGSWLHGIARNHCIDVLRRRRSVALEAAGPLVASQDVEATALRTIEHQRLQAAMDRLPTRDRALLVLRYWEDQSVTAIARAMRLSEGATKVALLRARRSLKEILKSEEVSRNAV
jgi:RNA polymerase sigma-70 factor (ECF subfamily)